MPLDDHLVRKDWIGPRQGRWTDILPESWQTAINTSPTLNALARYMSRKYGLLPPVAAGAAQSLSQGQDTAY